MIQISTRIIWVIVWPSYLKLLEEQGFSLNLINRALRLNVRALLREITGTITSALLGFHLTLIVFTFFRYANPRTQVYLIVFLIVYFSTSILFTSIISPRFTRLNAVPSAINTVLRTMKLVNAVRDINRSRVKPTRLRRFQKKRRTAYKGLQLSAWRISSLLAVSAGRTPRERDHPHSATLGKWFIYTSENLEKSECLDYTMQLCADTIRHLVEGRPWESPSLPSVPKFLTLRHPSHWQGRLRYLSAMRTTLMSLIPIIAAAVSAILRSDS